MAAILLAIIALAIAGAAFGTAAGLSTAAALVGVVILAILYLSCVGSLWSEKGPSAGISVLVISGLLGLSAQNSFAPAVLPQPQAARSSAPGHVGNTKRALENAHPATKAK